MSGNSAQLCLKQARSDLTGTKGRPVRTVDLRLEGRAGGRQEKAGGGEAAVPEQEQALQLLQTARPRGFSTDIYR
jgi:hypothetical protein